MSAPVPSHAALPVAQIAALLQGFDLLAELKATLAAAKSAAAHEGHPTTCAACRGEAVAR